ncbi:type II toxin-antitoxin system mRNA interferase toxin, RelE/StbE family [Candidatus Peregrinibacteria bacterium]|nr:type II toxin-antitoxin system mRNA interferase toxin, RelE/StbE family [Candidatus Peregrinibacteria bacterium]
MRIIFTEGFKKKYKRLQPKIQKQFEKRLELFIKNQNHPLLKVHPLKGNLVGCRAFSVTGDFRVIYRLLDQNNAKLIDIGTHCQVYK